MDFEGLEQVRADSTKRIMEALTKIVEDEKADLEHRLKAAKTVDGMSDSIIKARLLSDTVGLAENSNKNMKRAIDKLDKIIDAEE